MGLLEAAACGVPAIASRIGAIPELVAITAPDCSSIPTISANWSSECAGPGRTGRDGRDGPRCPSILPAEFHRRKNYEALISIYRKLLPA